MKVAFHLEQLDERGSTTTIKRYAQYNQTLLGNESYIICNRKGDLQGQSLVENEFPLLLYDNFAESEKFVKDNNIDVVYFLKAGINDGKLIPGVKNVIHAVFWYCQPHGDVYAYVSSWLSRAASHGNYPYVPHIVQLDTKDKGDYREFLGIPADALVLGYMGGRDSFAVPFAQQAVVEIAASRPDIYFLFMNIDPFCQPSSNIFFVDGTIDVDMKGAFVNTCDVCFHARDGGETFGLTIGEFSVNNKPVLTYGRHTHRAHIEMLGDKALLYMNKDHLIDIITHMDRNELAKGDWNAYSWYTPENVMDQFGRVFLS